MLKDDEMMLIDGGGVNYKILTAIGGLITFIIGAIYGYLKPIKS